VNKSGINLRVIFLLQGCKTDAHVEALHMKSVKPRHPKMYHCPSLNTVPGGQGRQKLNKKGRVGKN
jgi:hypothetical protein